MNQKNIFLNPNDIKILKLIFAIFNKIKFLQFASISTGIKCAKKEEAASFYSSLKRKSIV